MSIQPPKQTTQPAAAMGNALGAGGVTGAGQPQVPGAGQLSPEQFAAQQTAKAASSMAQYVNYINTNMGRVDMNAINKQVGGELNAEVSPLLNGLNAQQTSGQQAINSFTSQFANQLSSISGNIQGAYGQAEQQQSALDTAIAASLRGAGTDQANALQQTLQSAGQNIAPAAQAAQAASGAAGASFASGSASLSQLISQGASNAAYGAKLPGYAALEGLQATQGLQASIANARSQILGDAQKQVPTLTNQLVNQQLAAEKARGDSLLAGAKLQGQNAKNAQNYVTNLQDAATRQANAKIAASKAVFEETKPKVYGGSKDGYFALVPDGKGGYTNMQLTTPGQAPPTVKTYPNGLIESIGADGSVKILHAANPKPATLPTLKSVKGAFNGKTGTWQLNPKTGEKVPGSFIPDGKTAGSTTGSFDTASRELVKAATGKGGWATGTPPKYELRTVKNADGSSSTKQIAVNGTGSAALPYNEALQNAITMGPNTPQWKQHAVQYINSLPQYQEGQNGRVFTGQNAVSAAKNFVLEAVRDTKVNPSAQQVLQAGIATGVIPQAVLKKAIIEVYGSLKGVVKHNAGPDGGARYIDTGTADKLVP